MMSWSHIDTAPRDGSLILVFQPPNLYGCVRWRKGARNTGAWWYVDGTKTKYLPTHWMKLPEKPE